MKGKGRYVEVPAADYPPIEPACVILKRWQRKDAARAFLQFIQSPATGELLRSYGLELRKRNEQRLVRYFFAFFAAFLCAPCGQKLFAQVLTSEKCQRLDSSERRPLQNRLERNGYDR